MGVLNVTPNSFSDGGKYIDVDQAVERALRMIEEGADWIDVGGESSRPYAEPAPLEVELARVLPVITRLAACTTTPISIDTFKPEVMQAACGAGASMINDIYALRQPGALDMAAALKVPVVLMHMQHDPHTMQNNPHYTDVVAEVEAFFVERIQACLAAGIKHEQLILDPGFGFGKTAAHNCALLKQLKKYTSYQEKRALPILVGLSRKSLIGDLLGLPMSERLHPSVALAVYAVLQGARYVRTHDVLATRRAVDMVCAVEAERV
ncbi:MAG: dihydropteroate synthase [Gammaproteobacteria bacterium]|nr:dihydropteroate synthase [Gammaproteobacteria bacterium]